MKVYLTLLSLIYSITIYSQTLTINVSENKFGIDETLSLIVSRILCPPPSKCVRAKELTSNVPFDLKEILIILSWDIHQKSVDGA